MTRLSRRTGHRRAPSRLFLVDFILLGVIFWAAQQTYVATGLGRVAAVHDWQRDFWAARDKDMVSEGCVDRAVEPLALSDRADPVQQLTHLAGLVPSREDRWKVYTGCQEPKTFVVPEDLLHFRVNEDARFEADPEPAFASIRRYVDENADRRRAIFILGHTDDTFTDQYNNELSYRRARTIAAVVEAHLTARGLQVGRDFALYPIGMGKTQLLPREFQSVEDWRRACRRIELSFRGKGVGHGYDNQRAR